MIVVVVAGGAVLAGVEFGRVGREGNLAIDVRNPVVETLVFVVVDDGFNKLG